MGKPPRRTEAPIKIPEAGGGHGMPMGVTTVMHMAMDGRSLAFASMLHEAVKGWGDQKIAFKLPRWAIMPLSERKDQASLSATEQGRFLCALDTLIANGTFGPLVDIHADMTHMMHGTERFLPWHRVYLRQFEQALQSIHPDVTLPYWDWTNPTEQSIPGWLAGFTPTVITPTQTIPVNRFPGTAADLGAIVSNVPSIMSQTTFANFTGQLEGIVHNAVHVWVGGSMASIPTAPADPLFWMHHANIDRLWWQWHLSPEGTGKNPSLSGSDAILDPWATSEPATRDTMAMGYDYV